MALGFGSSHKAGISELFIMTKGGLLLRHYSDSLRTDVDRDALGGMLVAVQQFVQQTLASKSVANEGDAESLQYHVLDALQDFEDRYASTLESWNGDVAAFPGIDDCFEKVVKG